MIICEILLLIFFLSFGELKSTMDGIGALNNEHINFKLLLERYICYNCKPVYSDIHDKSVVQPENCLYIFWSDNVYKRGAQTRTLCAPVWGLIATTVLTASFVCFVSIPLWSSRTAYTKPVWKYNQPTFKQALNLTNQDKSKP